jgi:hypothetical protein
MGTNDTGEATILHTWPATAAAFGHDGWPPVLD